MSDTAVEIKFLLYVCRLDPDLQIDQKLENLPDSFDWELLVKISFDHGVTALLCHSLLLATPGFVPDEIHNAAAEFLRLQAETNKKQADQLTGILNELIEADIQAIPFKGMTLAINAYGNLNLRSSRDLDFLIQHKDISTCIEKLSVLGYRHERNMTPRQWQEFVKYTCEEILFGPGVPVEPHWAFTPHTLAINIDYPAIWQRSSKVYFNGQSVLSLSAEDELIVLCLHGCKEEWAKLKWIVDVAEFIRSHPALVWQDLITYATSQHISRIVKVSILLTGNMVDIQIPENVSRWINNDRGAISLARQFADEFFTRDKSGVNIWKPAIFHWSMRERLTDRLLYLLLTLTQPRDQHFADINIPDRLFLLYWPYRLLHDYLLLPIWKIVKRIRT
ncbi:MAG: nucleotidyltransferase family protein [Gammaproteobacteria bacterium]|nr:nucleotidyltransferase family protein [Gammaproteobacteria bacterium]